MNQKTFNVYSSHGTLVADAETGKILSFEYDEKADPGVFDNMDRFDVDEWKKTYPTENLDGYRIDILDLGIWDKDGTYGDPEHDWRKEFRNERNQS